MAGFFIQLIAIALTPASKSVRNIKSAWVNSQQALVDHGDVMVFRVDMKVSFVVD